MQYNSHQHVVDGRDNSATHPTIQASQGTSSWARDSAAADDGVACSTALLLPAPTWTTHAPHVVRWRDAERSANGIQGGLSPESEVDDPVHDRSTSRSGWQSGSPRIGVARDSSRRQRRDVDAAEMPFPAASPIRPCSNRRESFACRQGPRAGRTKDTCKQARDRSTGVVSNAARYPDWSGGPS